MARKTTKKTKEVAGSLPGRPATAGRRGDKPTPSASHASAPPKADLILVPIASIDATHNIRTDPGEESLGLLQASIEEIGMLQPVVVRKVGKTFQMVAGHRRLEAATRAGQDHVKAMVYDDTNDRWAAEAMLAENCQRLNLPHMDLAAVLGHAKDTGMTIAEIAASSHLSDDTVRRHLTLLRLTPPVAELVASGRLPVHQGELVSRLGDAGRQIELTESATRLAWNNASGKWVAAYGGTGRYKPGGGDQDVHDRDFVMPMDQLRKLVGYAMGGLAACGWPMAEEYAGHRACVGCEDNTLTHKDEPMLFVGLKPQGSATKGHCMNPACYKIKRAGWEKVKDQRKQERQKATATAIKKAKAAGVKVCEDCGKVGDVETVAGRTLCAKHAKSTKAVSGGGRRGEGYEAREKRINAAKRRFPETAEQRLAVALFDHGAKLAQTIGEGIGSGLIGDEVQTVVAAELVLWADGWETWNAGGRPKAVSLEQILHGGFPHAEMTARWEGQLAGFARRHGPRIGHEGKADSVPLGKTALAWIEEIETLAADCGIEIPERPTAETIAREAMRDTIVKGQRTEAEAAIATCEDLALIEEILAEAEAKTLKPKLAKWRDEALIVRLGALKGFAGDPRPMARKIHEDQVAEDPEGLTADQIDTASKPALVAECKRRGLSAKGAVTALRTRLWSPLLPPGICHNDECASNGLRNRILQGKKPDALAAIAEADAVEVRACIAIGLKGEWRQAAVAKRIMELTA